MLDINNIRKEMADYLSSHASHRHSLDAAVMHVVQLAYRQGMNDERHRPRLDSATAILGCETRPIEPLMEDDLTELEELARGLLWTGRWYSAGCGTVQCDYNQNGRDHDEVAHPVPEGAADLIGRLGPDVVIALVRRAREISAVTSDALKWQDAVKMAIERAKSLDDGSDGAHAECARSVVDLLAPLVSAGEASAEQVRAWA